MRWGFRPGMMYLHMETAWMADQNTTIDELKKCYEQFVSERDWEQYHSPKNLAMSLAVEAAELMEHFLWMGNEASRELLNDPATRAEVAEEIADIAGHVFCLCNSLGLDLSDTVRAKMVKNAQKYPADKYRGKYRLSQTTNPAGDEENHGS